MTKPATFVELIWERDLVFDAPGIFKPARGGESLKIDSDSAAGPSPMQLVAMGLAGCMAIDLLHILKKGRHDVRGLRAELRGKRADEEPRRFTDITLLFEITGNVLPEHVERAIKLSRDKYCSVWHSLRQDIDLHTTFTIFQ